jgi:hypothetical protein
MDDDVVLRQALHAYVTVDEPPARSLTEGVLVAGRRARRARAVAWIAGAVVAVVLLATSATAAMMRGGGGDGPVQPGPGCRSSGTGSSPEERIGCYLSTVVPSVRPDATLSYLDGPAGTEPLGAYRADEAAPGAFGASALVSDALGRGNLQFLIFRWPTPGTVPPEPCGEPGDCTLREGPHGETVAVSSSRFSDGDPPAEHIMISVTVYTGQTVVVAMTANTGLGVLTDDGRPGRPEPPLTVDQLIEIACGPALVIYP